MPDCTHPRRELPTSARGHPRSRPGARPPGPVADRRRAARRARRVRGRRRRRGRCAARARAGRGAVQRAAPGRMESLVDEAAVGPERIRVWDDERQKLTWMHALVETTEPPSAVAEEVVTARDAGTGSEKEKLDRALASRLSDLGGGFRRRRRRARTPRAGHRRRAAGRRLGGRAARRGLAAGGAERVAHEIPSPAPPTLAGRPARCSHLDASSPSAPPRSEGGLARRASALASTPRDRRLRVVRRRGNRPWIDPSACSRASGSKLPCSPSEPRAARVDLHRMADAYAADPRSAAWLHVESARVLDCDIGPARRREGRAGRALALEPGIRPGPQRRASVMPGARRRGLARRAAAGGGGYSRDSCRACRRARGRCRLHRPRPPGRRRTCGRLAPECRGEGHGERLGAASCPRRPHRPPRGGWSAARRLARPSRTARGHR